MSIKIITCCRKFVDILNFYGNFCSCKTVEELNTDEKFAAFNQCNIYTQGIPYYSHSRTAVTFDNFDMFDKTSSDKWALEDTIRIIFQKHDDCFSKAIDTIGEISNDHAPFQEVIKSGNYKKKIFRCCPLQTPFRIYIKKLGSKIIIQILFINNHELHQFIPSNVNCVNKLDLFWMMSYGLNVLGGAIWLCFNSDIVWDTTI